MNPLPAVSIDMYMMCVYCIHLEYMMNPLPVVSIVMCMMCVCVCECVCVCVCVCVLFVLFGENQTLA